MVSYDSPVARAWFAQIAEAAKTPGLAQQLVRRTGDLLPRFVRWYDTLRTLPRRMRRRVALHGRLTLGAAAMLLALWSGSARAATIVVDERTCPLSDAITAANLDSRISGCSAGSGGDIIVLNSDVTLTRPLPDIESEMTIRAGTHAAVDGSGNRCFLVDAGVAPVVLDGLTVHDCTGAAVSYGHLTVTDCLITDNNGSAVANFSGTLTIENTTISDNQTHGDGAGVSVSSHGDVTIVDSVLSGNRSRGGGAIYLKDSTLFMRRTVISGNTSADNGGGISIASYSPSFATMEDCLITGNEARSSGGGIAILEGEADGAFLTVRRSTISGNTARWGGGIGSTPHGHNQVRIEDSTISGNTANERGGGVYSQSRCNTFSDKLVLAGVTVSGNHAAEEGGGVFVGCPKFSLWHSLIAGNDAPTGPEIALEDTMRIPIDRYNLIGYDGDARTSGFTPGGTDVVPASGVQVADIVDPLADNGGFTPTHALPDGSPARDLVPTTDADCVGTLDQRGVSRPVGGGCDAGSVED